MGADLRIECDGPMGRNCRVWLDGEEISNYCHGVEIDIGVGEANTVTLHLFVDHIDLGLNGDVKVNAPLLRRSVDD
jgi:hypothetical protein